MIVDISEGTLEAYEGPETSFEMRLEASATYTDSDGVVVLGGRDTLEDYIPVACTVVGGLITFAAFQLRATTPALSNPRNAAFKISLYNGSNGKFYKTFYRRLYVPSTPNPTTLPALMAYSDPSGVPQPEDQFYTKTQVDALLAGLGTAPDATTLIKGKARLSVAAANPSQPIAVGDNDPRLVALADGDPETPVFRSKHTTFDLANVAALNKELSFNIQDNITATKTLDKFRKVSLRGDGKWNVSVGQGLTVENLLDPGDRKLNIGEGTLNIKNASFVRMAWFTGPFGGMTYVTEDIDGSETQISVADSSVFGAAPFGVCIDQEPMWCTVNDTATNTLTVTRGYDGVAAGTHTATVTTAEAIDASETEWDLVSGAAFGKGQFYALCDSELVFVENVVGNTAYVRRAQGGTAAATHSSGATLNKRPRVYSYVTTAMWTGINQSLAANGGSRLVCSPGFWATKGNVAPPQGCRLQGTGGVDSSDGGTIFRLISNNQPLFNVAGPSGWMGFDDITFDCKAVTSGTGVAVNGQFGLTSVQNVHFSRCIFDDGDYGCHQYDTIGVGAMVLNMQFEHCRFLSQDLACIRTHTSNGSNLISQTTFTPRGNGASVCLDFNYSGANIVMGCTFNGINVAPQTVQVDISAIDLATNKITTAAPHQCPVDRVVKVSVYNATPANLPTGTTNINRTTGTDIWGTAKVDRHDFYFRPISATEGYCYLDPQWAFLPNESDFRFNWTAAGTGTHNLRTNQPILDNTRPLAVARFQNTFNNALFLNCQDEGFPYTLIVENTFEEQRTITFKNCLIQAQVLLESFCVVEFEDCWVPANFITDRRQAGFVSSAEASAKNCQIVYSLGSGGYVDLGYTAKNPDLMTVNGCCGDTRVRDVTIPDQGYQHWDVPMKFSVGKANRLSSKPAVEFVRDRNIVELPIAKFGQKESWEEESSYYFDTFLLDPNLSPTYAWMAWWLEFRSRQSVITGQENGFFLGGHVAFRGTERNVGQTQLTSTGGVTTLDGSKSKYYYFATDIGEDTSLFLDTTPGREVRAYEEKVIRIECNGTNRNVIFGGGFLAGGIGNFNTGHIAGYWFWTFHATGGNQLELKCPPVFVGAGANIPPVIPGLYQYASGAPPQTLVRGCRYMTNGGGPQRFLLPVNANIGETFEIFASVAGGHFKLEQNALQQVVVTSGGVDGTNRTTAGTGGFLESTALPVAITIVCVGANAFEIDNGQAVAAYLNPT